MRLFNKKGTPFNKDKAFASQLKELKRQYEETIK